MQVARSRCIVSASFTAWRGLAGDMWQWSKNSVEQVFHFAIVVFVVYNRYFKAARLHIFEHHVQWAWSCPSLVLCFISFIDFRALVLFFSAFGNSLNVDSLLKT